jgi:hypothetical protein
MGESRQDKPCGKLRGGTWGNTGVARIKNVCGGAALASVRKKPLRRQSKVIPKVNSIEMFEIPACRSTQGRLFTWTTNMSRQVF